MPITEPKSNFDRWGDREKQRNEERKLDLYLKGGKDGKKSKKPRD